MSNCSRIDFYHVFWCITVILSTFWYQRRFFKRLIIFLNAKTVQYLHFESRRFYR